MTKNLTKWNLGHAMLLTIAGLTSMYLNITWPVFALSGLSFGLLIITQSQNWLKYKPWGGYANHLTFLRLLLLFIIPLLSNSYLVFGILLISIILDAFDGYLARKYHTESEFGSYLDVETDAFFTLVLTLSLVQLGFIEDWIIHAGLIRYYYILLKRLLGLHKRKEPRVNAVRYAAIAVFVFLFSPFVLPGEYHHLMISFGVSVLIISFSFSFLSLFRAER